MAKIKSDDWRNLPLEEWNVRTFHAYLIERNKEERGVDYVPFGKGPISQRWRTEQGQIKNAQKEYGNETVKAFIDYEFDNLVVNRKFPCLNFGFIFAYRRDDIPTVQHNLTTKKKTEEYIKKTKEQETEVGDDWY